MPKASGRNYGPPGSMLDTVRSVFGLAHLIQPVWNLS
jgi:hypothetical protein